MTAAWSPAWGPAFGAGAPVFPSLPGLGWSVTKTPTWSTLVAPHVSGREVRVPLYAFPLYDIELTFEGLDSSPTGTYSGLGLQSQQTLMGFYAQMQGAFGTFLFSDPTDDSATQQTLGYGTGSATAFTFGRALTAAAPIEPVGWVTSVATVYLDGVAQPSNAWSLTNPNTLNLVDAPLGAPAATQLLAEDSSTGAHDTSQSIGSQSSGTAITFTVYAMIGARSALGIVLYNGSATIGPANFNLATGQVGALPSGVTSQSIAALGGGWFACSVTFTMAATGSPIFAVVLESPFGTDSYAGTTGDGLYLSGAYWGPAGGAMTALPAWSAVSGATLTTTTGSLPPPSNGMQVSATFGYDFLCKFAEDALEFEQFMNNLWRVKSCKLQTVRPW